MGGLLDTDEELPQPLICLSSKFIHRIHGLVGTLRNWNPVSVYKRGSRSLHRLAGWLPCFHFQYSPCSPQYISSSRQGFRPWNGLLEKRMQAVPRTRGLTVPSSLLRLEFVVVWCCINSYWSTSSSSFAYLHYLPTTTLFLRFDTYFHSASLRMNPVLHI